MRRNSRQAAERPPRRKTVFLAALVDTVNVTLTCRRADIPRRTAYDWREADEGFARKWDDAVDEGIDLLEAELHKRAFEGVERPVYYKGEQVGTWRFYSDALAMFLLKAHRPERYRGAPSFAKALEATPEERAAAARELAARGQEPRPYPSPPPVPKDWSEGKEIQRATPAPCLGKLSG